MSNDIWKMIPSSILAVAAPLFLAFVVTACNKPTEESSGVTIEHEITPHPVRVGPATLTLRLADARRQPVTGASIMLEGNMSHAGMSPVFAQAKETEPGRYQAIVDLSMAGDWNILTHITLAGGQKLERQLDVKGVRAN
ncbi:MAG: FixH family protein [Pyrinomonadaceae bacterium]|nr:FixH family protein [Pyrinomonadaceae bacterium]